MKKKVFRIINVTPAKRNSDLKQVFQKHQH